MIENNQNRVGETLYTNQEDGELVTLDCYRNVKDEATEISSTIEKYKGKNSLNEIAILVRLFSKQGNLKKDF